MAAQQQQRVQRKVVTAVDYLGSAFTAAVVHTAVAPVERVGLLLQTHGEHVRAGRMVVPFAGAADCFRRMVLVDGYRGLWQGNSASIFKSFLPTQLAMFALKAKLAKLHGITLERHGAHRWFVANLATGAAAGAVVMLVVYPVDYARVRLIGDLRAMGGTRRFGGLLDVFRKTIAADGVGGLYRGFSGSLAGVAVYRGLYFGLYDTVKRFVPHDVRKSFPYMFLLSWSVTLTSGIAAYPLSTVCHRMMMTSAEPVASYRNPLHALKEIARKEGFRSLYRGCALSIGSSVASAALLALSGLFHI